VWHPFDGGGTIGTAGSENGTIVSDDEHDLGGRITLEIKTRSAPFAITCGIYGWMVHTRYFGTENDASRAFDDMKVELDAIIRSIPMNDDPEGDRKMGDVCDRISDFVDRFP
jgi:hypothetical protein